MENVPNMELFLMQKGRCFYCGAPMMATRAKGGNGHRGWTIDHFLPKSRGNGKASNKVMSCQKCNRDKGDRLPNAYERKKFNRLYKKIYCRRADILRIETK